MAKKAPNLYLKLPQCRHCGRDWRPLKGVDVTKAFCRKCAKDRHAQAKKAFDLRPIDPFAEPGPYLIPRKLKTL